METLVHADIFFFITSIAVALLSIGFVIVLIYVIAILRDMKHISNRVKEESDHIIEDITVLRSHVKQEGFKIKHVTRFFGGLFGKKSSRAKKED